MDASVIVQIHEYVTAYFEKTPDPVSPPGVKNMDTIESAASRPYSTAGGRDAYPTTFLKAASLFHSVASNHSFHNGNKRTALLSTLYFLSEFGFWVDKCNDEEMFEFTRRIAAHEICEDRRDEVPIIADWLEANSRKQQKGERQLKFHDLRASLGRFDYSLEEDGMFANIYKDGTVVERILKKGTQGFQDYDEQYISGIRKRLELTPEFGIDSARFYGQKGLSEDLNVFMQMRIEVMRRLART